MDGWSLQAQILRAMQIFAPNGLWLPRWQASPSVTAHAGERTATLDGSIGQSSEVKAQRRAAADASAFVAAQDVRLTNGIIGVEGAVAGTSIDVRV